VVPANVHQPDEAELFATHNHKCASERRAVELFVAPSVTDTARFISHIALAKIVREWQQRLPKCIDMEGDYVR
jgi:hypothetical protein